MLSLQEAWTDNILNTTNNRRWDVLTLFTPSIAITGDVPNAQVQFQYGPQFRLAARTPQENGVTNQLVGTGLFTIVQDEFYVDARAFAGGSPVGGGFGALGPGVTPNFGGLPPPTRWAQRGSPIRTRCRPPAFRLRPTGCIASVTPARPRLATRSTKSSFSRAIRMSRCSSRPAITPGYNVTNEGVAQFETGDRFAPFRNLTIADAQIGNGNFQGNSNIHRDRPAQVPGEPGYHRLRPARLREPPFRRHTSDTHQ